MVLSLRANACTSSLNDSTGNTPVHEPDVERLLRVDRLPGHDHPLRPVWTENPGEAADPSRPWQRCDVHHFRQREHRALGREAEVTGRSHLDANSEAVGLCGQDDRLLDRLHLVEEVVIRLGAVLAAHVRPADDPVGAFAHIGAQVLEVESGREVAPFARDHEDALRVVVAEVADCFGEGREHLVSDGVSLRIACERHRDHAVDVVAAHLVSCHRGHSPRTSIFDLRFRLLA